MSNIRTRIAPSPTGALHVGTARTALFNYLFAKKHGGAFVLRIEDTDLERSDQRFEKDILDSLKWLGISYDEGPDFGGPHAPYRQSERLSTYKKHLEKLLADKNAFYCFHSEAELEVERERLLTEKKPPIHVCEYRDFFGAEAEKLLKEKPEHIIRFRTPSGRKINFDDLIRGEISFESDLMGDFSLAKDLATPLYNFAVVVDDFEMQISHVIRGEDHISNTPKQILIQESLGFPLPVFAHLPLILGPDRSKLSKRHSATSIVEYREAGYLPEALVNFMALLGWNPGTEEELFSLDELVRAFDFDKVQESGAVFNIEKLDWMNGEYIRKISPPELIKLAMPFFPAEAADKDPKYIQRIVALEQPRLKKLSAIGEMADYFFRDPEYLRELMRWKKMSEKEIVASLDKSIEILSKAETKEMTVESLSGIFLAEAETMGARGKLIWPLRVALPGKKSSPGPFEVMEILGKDESLKRIEKAKDKFVKQ